MILKQLYTKCLAEAAYLIGSNGEAAIIDPLRETQPYLDLLKEHNLRLKYIFETHFHADFVSGHLDLARQTGATIVYGPKAKTNYEIYNAKDNEYFELGELKFQLLHTPGHTPESSCYLLFDEQEKQHALFSGDTLFIGDVGRPDLAIKSDLSREDLAGMLYDSLHEKIGPLADEVIVYPAHGAGSSCGKSMSKETFDTLRNQKSNNYAFNLSRTEFIKELTTGILPPPHYFAKAAVLNQKGYNSIQEVLDNGDKALNPAAFKQKMTEDVLVLDVRTKNEFRKAHIPNSISIGLDGMFAIWVGTVLENQQQPILIITPDGREKETVKRLARVGYDNCIGYLEGGLQAWEQVGSEVATISSVKSEDLNRFLHESQVLISDVRKPSEFDNGHLQAAINLPLDFIIENVSDYDQNKSYLVHCKSGYRSMTACSILQKNGIKVFDLMGGYDAVKTLAVA